MPEGEPWTLHDIRRTVATRLYEAGIDVLTVEDLLGHTTGVAEASPAPITEPRPSNASGRRCEHGRRNLAALVRKGENSRNVVKLQKKR